MRSRRPWRCAAATDMSANDYTIAESERRIGVEKSQETTS
jgi:hypothetical protein